MTSSLVVTGLGPEVLPNAVHELKCTPDFFDAVKRGDKTFDLRKNDRGFQRGDILVLLRYGEATFPHQRTSYLDARDQAVIKAAADSLRVLVTYVLNGYGLESGHVALAIRLLGTDETLSAADS